MATYASKSRKRDNLAWYILPKDPLNQVALAAPEANIKSIAAGPDVYSYTDDEFGLYYWEVLATNDQMNQIKTDQGVASAETNGIVDKDFLLHHHAIPLICVLS
jgi:hypothetical protein